MLRYIRIRRDFETSFHIAEKTSILSDFSKTHCGFLIASIYQIRYGLMIGLGEETSRQSTYLGCDVYLRRHEGLQLTPAFLNGGGEAQVEFASSLDLEASTTTHYNNYCGVCDVKGRYQ